MSVPIQSQSQAVRGSASALPGLLASARPKHWIKNIPVFAALVFSPAAVSFGTTATAAVSFVAFCLLASSVYLLNDLCDVDEDRKHPEKCRRPLAAGIISPEAAVLTIVLGAGAAITIAFAINWIHGCVLLSYFAMNVAYSWRLKHEAVLDVILIATGFVLRAVAGAVAIGVYASGWLVMTTLFLALFIGFTKRRSELTLLGDEAAGHRACLAGYSMKMLNFTIPFCAIAAVALYSVYTLAPNTVQRFGTDGLIWTLPFVVVGLWRFARVSQDPKNGGDPATLIFHDAPLLVTTGLWLLVACVVIYGPVG